MCLYFPPYTSRDLSMFSWVLVLAKQIPLMTLNMAWLVGARYPGSSIFLMLGMYIRFQFIRNGTQREKKSTSDQTCSCMGWKVESRAFHGCLISNNWAKQISITAWYNIVSCILSRVYSFLVPSVFWDRLRIHWQSRSLTGYWRWMKYFFSQCIKHPVKTELRSMHVFKIDAPNKLTTRRTFLWKTIVLRRVFLVKSL